MLTAATTVGGGYSARGRDTRSVLCCWERGVCAACDL